MARENVNRQRSARFIILVAKGVVLSCVEATQFVSSEASFPPAGLTLETSTKFETRIRRDEKVSQRRSRTSLSWRLNLTAHLETGKIQFRYHESIFNFCISYASLTNSRVREERRDRIKVLRIYRRTRELLDLEILDPLARSLEYGHEAR